MKNNENVEKNDKYMKIIENMQEMSKNIPKTYINYLSMAKSIKIGEFFSLYEMTYSSTAISNNISNIPDLETINNAVLLCMNILDPLRKAKGPVICYSFYRNKKLNAAIGGAKTSQHVKGEAVDFDVIGYKTREKRIEIIRHIVRTYMFDQVILEPSWIHVSYSSKSNNRRQILEKTKDGYVRLVV